MNTVVTTKNGVEFPRVLCRICKRESSRGNFNLVSFNSTMLREVCSRCREPLPKENP